MSAESLPSLKMLEHLVRWTAPHPSILWIELTSKCPFRCSFCLRRESRHPGEHMDPALLRGILGQLHAPEIIRLQNAGESIHYPHLIHAIHMSRMTGARVELVTTLASAPMELLPELLNSGLDQLTVSLHTTDPDQYQCLYGFASFEALNQRLRWLVQQRTAAQSTVPVINLSFVATRDNLQELPRVSRYAHELGIREIQVHRIIWRNSARERFTHELHANLLTEVFRKELEETVQSARALFPDLALVYANNALDEAVEPGSQPAFYAKELPVGCCIADCIENPWETLNILSNGDVLACGCRSPEQALGNLNRESLDEVWSGSAFREFRARYFLGQDESCRRCPWKKVFIPGMEDAKPSPPARGPFHLLRGWYLEEKSSAIWSRPEAVALLASSGKSARPGLSISGFLPNPDRMTPNRLEILCNGIPVGKIINRSRRMLEFAATVPMPPGADPPFCLQFKTTKGYCPSKVGDLPDIRTLGFALTRLTLAEDESGRLSALWAKLRARWRSVVSGTFK